jgi:pimeloyl-ACP methyl ester carboxylesterase
VPIEDFTYSALGWDQQEDIEIPAASPDGDFWGRGHSSRQVALEGSPAASAGQAAAVGERRTRLLRTPEATRELASRIPYAVYRETPELGHFPHAENAEVFSQHLRWALDAI